MYTNKEHFPSTCTCYHYINAWWQWKNLFTRERCSPDQVIQMAQQSPKYPMHRQTILEKQIICTEGLSWRSRSSTQRLSWKSRPHLQEPPTDTDTSQSGHPVSPNTIPCDSGLLLGLCRRACQCFTMPSQQAVLPPNRFLYTA